MYPPISYIHHWMGMTATHPRDHLFWVWHPYPKYSGLTLCGCLLSFAFLGKLIKKGSWQIFFYMYWGGGGGRILIDINFTPTMGVGGLPLNLLPWKGWLAALKRAGWLPWKGLAGCPEKGWLAALKRAGWLPWKGLAGCPEKGWLAALKRAGWLPWKGQLGKPWKGQLGKPWGGLVTLKRAVGKALRRAAVP